MLVDFKQDLKGFNHRTAICTHCVRGLQRVSGAPPAGLRRLKQPTLHSLRTSISDHNLAYRDIAARSHASPLSIDTSIAIILQRMPTQLRHEQHALRE